MGYITWNLLEKKTASENTLSKKVLNVIRWIDVTDMKCWSLKYLAFLIQVRRTVSIVYPLSQRDSLTMNNIRFFVSPV